MRRRMQRTVCTVCCNTGLQNAGGFPSLRFHGWKWKSGAGGLEGVEVWIFKTLLSHGADSLEELVSLYEP